MKKIYLIIALTIILLIINILLSLYIDNDDEYYEENYLSHYYKLKNMPTIIPFEFEEPIYEYEDDDYFYYQNVDDIEFPKLYNYKYNNSNKYLNYCYSLLSQFLACLSAENENSFKCQNLFYEKLNELEKCDIINFNNSMRNYKKNLINFNFNFEGEDMYKDIQDDFQKEKIFNGIEDFSLKLNGEIEDDEKDNNQIALFQGNFDENPNKNKDCVEYGLTEDDYIICTKYE